MARSMVLKTREIWGPLKGPLLTSKEEVPAPPYVTYGQKIAYCTCIYCDYPYKWYDIIPEDLPDDWGHPATHPGDGFYITYKNSQGIQSHGILPKRCTDCDTRYRRYKRCNEAVNKLRDIADPLTGDLPGGNPPMRLRGLSKLADREMYKYLKPSLYRQ
jgi:hypothetical protein